MSADYFATITVADYAAMAFGADQTGKPSAAFDGGMYAGKGTAWERQGEPDTAANARLVPVMPPKVLVRWCDSAALTAAKNTARTPVWWAAAAGAWWSSDAMADVIVRRTVARFGASGDSGLVAREYSAVKYEWKSDMRGVIVCELTRPIRALLGVGRPVVTQAPGDPSSKTLGNRELQYVILTEIPRGTFRAHDFMKPLFVGSSTGFTQWWQQQNIAGKRREQVRANAAMQPRAPGRP